MIDLKKILNEKSYNKSGLDLKKNLINLNNEKKHYSDSFFEEYKRYPKIQLDSFNNLNLNEERFYSNSKWNQKDLKNKNILEVGSGAGKFTEILIKSGCNLITTDSSDAININFKNNHKLDISKTVFIKTNANETIFRDNIFDYVVLYGVLQNVDNQKKIIGNCISQIKKGGSFTLDVTRANKFNLHLLNPKYFWRNITKRMCPEKVFKIVSFMVSKYIEIDTFFKKNFGFFGRIISKIFFPFPLINYYYLPLSKEMKLNMSILDTFDALASTYDKPLTGKKLNAIIESIQVEKKIKFQKIEIEEKQNLVIANITI